MTERIKELSAAVASGDSEAFARFFRERFGEMYAEARRVSGRDESFCMDVVQDAMLRVIRSMKPTDSEQRLRSWLRVVVQTCAYDRLRMEARQRRREQEVAGLQSTDPQDEAMKDRLQWLQSEISMMDDTHAQLLVMRYRLGWTLQRIGRLLGLKSGAVDGRLKRLTTSLSRRARETFND